MNFGEARMNMKFTGGRTISNNLLGMMKKRAEAISIGDRQGRRGLCGTESNAFVRSQKTKQTEYLRIWPMLHIFFYSHCAMHM